MSRAVLVALALALNGCGLLTRPEPIPTGWEQRRAALEALQGFSLNGRLSGTMHGGSANVRWQQEGDAFSMRLSGPFGLGTLTLTGTPHRVEARSRNEVVVTDDPENYLRARLGWSLPLRSLRFWVRGLPAPGESRKLWDEWGRLASLDQDGWTVLYEEYRTVGEHDLPRRILLTQTDLMLTLLVDEWPTLGPTDAEH